MMLKADLGWLRGYPLATSGDGLRWQVLLPSDQGRVSVERVRLSRTTTTVNRLNREFPRVLSAIVGDRALWTERVTHVLAALKPSVHQGAPAPNAETALASVFSRRTNQRLGAALRATPRHADVLRAVAWSCALDEEALDRILHEFAPLARLLDNARPLLGANDLEQAVHWCISMASDGFAAFSPLFELASAARAYRYTTYDQGFAARVERALEGGSPSFLSAPELGSARLGVDAAECVLWLTTQGEAQRKRALALFAAVVPFDTLGAWEQWWESALLTFRQVRSILLRSSKYREQELVLGAFERIRRLSATTPPTFSSEELFRLIRWSAGDLDDAFADRLLRVLQELPDAPTRFALASHLCGTWGCGSPSRLNRIVERFREYLRATASVGDARFEPWRELFHGPLKKYRFAHFDDHLATEDYPLRAIDVLFARLTELTLTVRAPSAREAQRLLDMTGAPVSAKAALRAAEALVGEFAGHHFAPELVSGALTFCGEDSARFAALMRVFSVLEHHEERAGLLSVIETLRQMGREDVFALLAGGFGPRLAHVGRVLADERSLRRLAVASLDEQPAWARRFPEELRGLAHDLARVHPDAEKVVQRILGEVYPDPDRLSREIGALQRRLADQPPNEEHLRQRLRALQLRLEQPGRPSAAKVARLLARLEHAYREALVASWEVSANDVATGSLRRSLGIDLVPDWLLAPKMRRYLTPLARLEAPMRALAIRLLKVRLGDPPWDLRDDPANLAFQRKMQARGIVMEPWIDGLGTVRRQGRNGTELRVWLADDPLHVFEMGAHFQTCLSPNQFNYFSVFANAADINKRVLYASDSRGQVLGRCLFALTPQGGILCFHPYSHDSGLDFEAVVRGFASELASRMSTQLVPAGKVDKLVATDWYDDGPVDLVGGFAWLAEGSPLRRSIPELGPDAFMRELEAAANPLELNELTLPPVLDFPELKARPDLLAPLLARVALLPELSSGFAIDAARLAIAIGLVTEARVWFTRHVEHGIERIVSDFTRLEALRVLRVLAPTRVLGALKRTREKPLRHWEGESADRLEIAGLALEDLKRPAQALRLYELAAKAPGSMESKRRCAERREALAARRRV
jgi:hypothetical protein